MKEKINNVWKVIKNHPKTALLAVLIVGGGIAFAASDRSDTTSQIKVVKGDVAQEVAVTGKTVPVREVTLSFDRSGRVASVFAFVGDRVAAGQMIASLSTGELVAERNRALATLSEEQVKLEQIKRTSQSASVDARANMIATIRNSYTRADDALRNNIDQFFKNPRQANTYIEFSFKDGATEYKFPLNYNLQQSINYERVALEEVLIEWEKSIRSIDSAEDLTPYIVRADANLSRVKAFLNQVAYVANGIESVEFAYEPTINRYKATVSSARNDINGAITTFIAAREKYASAPAQVGSSGQFDLVAAQEARIASARAQVASQEAQLAKAVIRAPFSGLITKQDAKVGETVSVGAPLVGLISDGMLEIEANVSEVNIGKVTVGDGVRIVFDAFPDKTYRGKVSVIEPAETIVDKVVNYRIKVFIEGDTAELKSGLTANLTIETAIRKDVLKVPTFSIKEGGDTLYVDVLINGEVLRRDITIGLIGNDSNAEVLSGLSEGDIVLAPAPAK